MTISAASLQRALESQDTVHEFAVSDRLIISFDNPDPIADPQAVRRTVRGVFKPLTPVRLRRNPHPKEGAPATKPHFPTEHRHEEQEHEGDYDEDPKSRPNESRPEASRSDLFSGDYRHLCSALKPSNASIPKPHRWVVATVPLFSGRSYDRILWIR